MRLIYIYPNPSKILHVLVLEHRNSVSATDEPKPKKGLKVSASLQGLFDPVAANADDSHLGGKAGINVKCANYHIARSYGNGTRAMEQMCSLASIYSFLVIYTRQTTSS